MSLNILVVDDSDIIRRMILKTMRLAEIPVSAAYEASDGREALEVLQSEWIDLVLADINMPVMDGLQMMRRMRATEGMTEVPVIIVSTEGSTSRIAELEQLGAAAFIQKPFTPEQIRDVVNAVVSDLDGGVYEGLAQSVSEALAGVTSRFVLMESQPISGGSATPGAQDGELLEAYMTFSGKVFGSMRFSAPHRLCVEMAANSIGVGPDHELATTHAGDALGELLNISCGTLAMAIEPESPTDLEPPSVNRIGRDVWDARALDTGTMAFSVDGHPLLVTCLMRVRQ